VGDVRDEAPVAGLGGQEPLDRRLQRVGHPVELGGPGAEFVARRGRDSRVQLPAGDPRGGPARGVDRTQDPARDRPGGGERHPDQHERANEQRDSELGQGAVDGARVVDEEDRRPAGRRPTRQDERRVSGHGRPRVPDLAAVHDRPQLAWETGERPDQVERGDDRVPVTEIDDRLDVASQPERLEQAGRRERRPIDAARQRRRDQDSQVVVGLPQGIRPGLIPQ
jgi:hypothetical protein